MKRHSKIIAGVLLAGTTLVPFASQARVDIGINIGPPPPRVVVVPPPRRGYVWAPGYYVYDGPRRHHVWHDGYWVRNRPGYHWRADGWDQRDGRWYRHHGGWER